MDEVFAAIARAVFERYLGAVVDGDRYAAVVLHVQRFTWNILNAKHVPGIFLSLHFSCSWHLQFSECLKTRQFKKTHASEFVGRFFLRQPRFGVKLGSSRAEEIAVMEIRSYVVCPSCEKSHVVIRDRGFGNKEYTAIKCSCGHCFFWRWTPKHSLRRVSHRDAVSDNGAKGRKKWK